jgi:carbonic anhydrase
VSACTSPARSITGWSGTRSGTANPLEAITLPTLLPTVPWAGIAVGVLTVALVARVESLLSAVADDRMHDGPRARPDRELVGQGAANTMSGLLGGLPVTGVIVRSATNVRSGARTRAAAVLHGVWISVFVVALVGVVELVPLMALSGLLVVVGLQLVRNATRPPRARPAWQLPMTVPGVGV